MSDLIERLRFRHAKGHKGLEETMQEAADALEQQAGEIERLRAENAELRKALEAIKRNAGKPEFVYTASRIALDAAMEGKK